MTESTRCTGVNAHGDRCRRWPQPGKDLCWWHDPQAAAEREAGFRTLPAPEPLTDGPVRLETAEEIRQFLTELANRLVEGSTTDTARVHSLATLAGVLLRTVRLKDLQAEITRLRAENENLTRAHAETDRQLTYARQDADRYRQSLTDLRNQLHPGGG